MNGELKPYPKYKDSGQAWIGQVPEHWDTRRFKVLFQERVRKGFPDEPLLAATQSKGVVQKKDYSTRTVTAQKDFHLLKLVEIGDFVISLRSFQGGIELSHCRGIISPAYTILKPTNSIGQSYFRHYLKSTNFIQSLTIYVTGIREGQNIDYERLSRSYLSIPPLDEQKAIGRFLDYATSRIDAAIRAKRKIIALLEEEKRAIIQRAVTKGIDPNAKMKDSGVPWIGEIPEGWEVRRLKTCISQIEQGWSPQCDAQPSNDNEWGVLKVGCVNKDKFDGSKNKRLPRSFSVDDSLEIQDGDILVSRANTQDLLGLAALAEKPRSRLILCDKLFRFHANKGILSSGFLVRVLRAKPSRVQIERNTNGASSSMQNIGQNIVKNLWIAFPKIPEQEQIINSITLLVIPIDNNIARLESEISLLREYRTRLVADVVTGKLDVRKAAEGLPALEEATASLDTEALEDEEDAEAEADDA
jgi:type I restriction enzyme S subunit